MFKNIHFWGLFIFLKLPKNPNIYKILFFYSFSGIFKNFPMSKGGVDLNFLELCIPQPHCGCPGTAPFIYTFAALMGGPEGCWCYIDTMSGWVEGLGNIVWVSSKRIANFYCKFSDFYQKILDFPKHFLEFHLKISDFHEKIRFHQKILYFTQ